ncbi:hypothetical protein TNCV_1836081 [Trichonephila clavipes]|nr:hypothetical protein TNCV_1836081 [Trichonephila clavipes]
MANNQSANDIWSLTYWEVGGKQSCRFGIAHSIAIYPVPAMTGTFLNRRHTTQATGNTFYRGQKTARWWSVCTTPCTVCTFNACPSEKTFSVVPGPPELERQ